MIPYTGPKEAVNSSHRHFYPNLVGKINCTFFLKTKHISNLYIVKFCFCSNMYVGSRTKKTFFFAYIYITGLSVLAAHFFSLILRIRETKKQYVKNQHQANFLLSPVRETVRCADFAAHIWFVCSVSQNQHLKHFLLLARYLGPLFKKQR